ncbi:MAG TPA: redoxin domain-containing protein [Methylomirabilota bacterium]|nr:redoxin domain-containing protein [Methylomirabilota bacterium]
MSAEIVGVSADPPERNLAWNRELRLPFRLLSDRQGEVGRLFGVWDDTWNLDRRVTFVIDRTRRVRFVETGSLAVETSRTLEAVSRLAKSK